MARSVGGRNEIMILDILHAMHTIFLKYAGKKCTDKNGSYIYHERTWYQVANAGFMPEDVELYLRWISDQNLSREEKYKRKFNIRKMFSSIESFEAELSEAKAWHRNLVHKPTPKESALRELRPIVAEVIKDSARPAKDIVTELIQKNLKAFRPDERRIGRNPN